MKSRAALGSATALALVLALAACTGGETDSEGRTSQPAGDTGAEGGDSGAGGDGVADTAADFEKAADTALAEVDGTVIEVGHEPDAWDVMVVTDDGSEHEIDLSADATTVTRHRVETAADDPDDAAERRRLLGAPVGLVTALETALAEVEGTVSGVGLAEDGGGVVWEVEMDDETRDAVTVAVDAGTGEVVGTDREE